MTEKTQSHRTKGINKPLDTVRKELNVSYADDNKITKSLRNRRQSGLNVWSCCGGGGFKGEGCGCWDSEEKRSIRHTYVHSLKSRSFTLPVNNYWFKLSKHDTYNSSLLCFSRWIRISVLLTQHCIMVHNSLGIETFSVRFVKLLVRWHLNLFVFVLI